MAPGEAGARPAFDLGPYGIERHRLVILAPAVGVTDVSGRLKREHSEAHSHAGTDHVGDLIEVAWRDRHVVGEVVPHSVLAPQPLESFDERPPGRVQLRFVGGPAMTAMAEHQGVEVAREAQQIETGKPVGSDRQSLQILVVEIAMGHAHRPAAVPAHRGQGRGVIVGIEQRHLPPISCAC